MTDLNTRKSPKRGKDTSNSATMFLPAATLMVAGLLLGLVPELQPAIVGVAEQFVNNGAYTAHVLDDSPIPPPAHEPSVPPKWSMALLSVFVAITIAGTHLASGRAREVLAKLADHSECCIASTAGILAITSYF